MVSLTQNLKNCNKINKTNFGKSDSLIYHGANCFRLRVILATIFRRAIVIEDIRLNDSINPGIQNFEASLLKLIDKITDGGQFMIDVTGTRLEYKPGMITGGIDLYHDCGNQRNLSYFLEAILMLAPFAKTSTSIKLKGITHGTGSINFNDVSIDHFRAVAIPLATKCGVQGLELKVIKKSLAPIGNGVVEMVCDNLKNLIPFEFIEDGRVKRVRGTSFISHQSPQFGVRLIDKCRGMLNDYLPDVWIYTSCAKKNIDADSKGYTITVVAETMKGFFKAADITVDDITRDTITTYLNKKKNYETKFSEILHRKTDITDILKKDNTEITRNEKLNLDNNKNISDDLTESEIVGRLVAQRLLLEIYAGGITDTTYQHIPFLFMAVAEEIKPSKHLRDFAGVTFFFEKFSNQSNKPPSYNQEDISTDDDMEEKEAEEEKNNDKFDIDSKLPDVTQYLIKCVGLGYKNVGRRTC